MEKCADQSTDHTSIDMIQALENTLSAKLRQDSPMSAGSCIFRVPHVLRRHNPVAYGPLTVSIGPIHRGRKLFQATENVKKWYLHNFLLQMKVSLKTLIEGMIGHEKKARDFYADPLHHLNQNDFIEIMILDGCFLIQLFLKSFLTELKSEDDPIFSTDCLLKYLFRDVLLLENQIPWFILHYLHTLTLDNYPEVPTLRILILTAFSSESQLANHCTSYIDYLFKQGDDDDVDDNDGTYVHILHLIRSSIVFPFQGQSDQSLYDPEIQLLHPASALSKANVEFKKGSADSITSIDFNGREFTIPQLEIGKLTESLFRNLIAFEQCFHCLSHKVTSYVALMNSLIASSNDIRLLCNEGIIKNRLTAEDASQFFNKLYNDTLLSKFYYSGICLKANSHYDNIRKMWFRDLRLSPLKTLKRDYCSSIWKVVSIVAGFMLLVLTIMQTTYTMLQYYSPLQ